MKRNNINIIILTMNDVFYYSYENKQYLVCVTYKKSRTISYHFRDGKFVIYAPKRTKKEIIIKGLDKFASRLIDSPFNKATNEEYLYLLGQRINLSSISEINFNNGNKITFKNREELNKKLKKWFLEIMKKRTTYYQKLMNISSNIVVKVRKMTTRYGSNSIYRSKNENHITYNTFLMHYCYDIIDAIIVHELAHCFIHGHGNDFYKVVYKYCPNYKQLHKYLVEGDFNGKNN